MQSEIQASATVTHTHQESRLAAYVLPLDKMTPNPANLVKSMWSKDANLTGYADVQGFALDKNRLNQPSVIEQTQLSP